MHELSIAQALAQQVRQYVSSGVVIRQVRMQAGPMRCIAPQAMQWAWKAATVGTELEQVELQLDLLPWNLQCTDCGQSFTAEDLFTGCPCGCNTTFPVGGDELTLMSLEIDDLSEAGAREPALPSAR